MAAGRARLEDVSHGGDVHGRRFVSICGAQLAGPRRHGSRAMAGIEALLRTRGCAAARHFRFESRGTAEVASADAPQKLCLLRPYAARRCGGELMLRQEVLGVAAAQMLAHVGVGTVPEACKIARDLHGALRGGEKLKG